MSIRKVSDLQGLYTNSSDYTKDNFKESLMELSYNVNGINEKQEEITRFVSRYMPMYEVINIFKSEIDLEPIYAMISALSERIQQVDDMLKNLSCDYYGYDRQMIVKEESETRVRDLSSNQFIG